MRHAGPAVGRLGKLLRSVRVSRNLTLTQAAACTGLSSSVLSNLETGKTRRLSKTALAKLSKGYGLAAELLGAAVHPDGPADLRSQAQRLRDRAAELERSAVELEGAG
jgi:transcriptional regulator with XRE-family HTH domain